MTIGEIASSAENRMDELFQNCQFLEQNFGFPNWTNCRDLLIFYTGKFQKFLIGGISKICNVENSKNLQSEKLEKFAILKILKFSNLENPKISK